MSLPLPAQSEFERVEKLRKEAEAYLKIRDLKEGLPHLHKFPHYPWSRKFFESTNKMNFLCAANQISKSSTQIRKAIHWATDTSLWPSLWRTKPNLFWYFYPSKEVASVEFDTKWRQFLPQGKYKEHPSFGWKSWNDKEGFIGGIEFNTGVQIHFRAYSQKAAHLQAATVYAAFCDEELPEHLYDEIKFRLAATDGYFHMVFTATLGQLFWHDTIEEVGNERERFKDALKIQVSLYDCLQYEDGSETPWNDDRIRRIIRDCKNDQEIQRRVFGRFVKSESQLMHGFNRKHHVIAPRKIHLDWPLYAGIDIGSGGEAGHPAAITFISVSPNHQLGYIVSGWRGDKIRTTAGDVLAKYKEMCRYLPPVTACYYDFAAADFATLASRGGVPVLKADKSHEKGLHLMNTLFKNNMLYIFEDNELIKLVAELTMATGDVVKRARMDDFLDSARYCVTGIPWDTSKILNRDEAPVQKPRTVDDERRAGFLDGERPTSSELAAIEMEEWNELYG